jgi:hypothetical protein
MKKIYKYLIAAIVALPAANVNAAETILIKNFSPDASGLVYNQDGISVRVVKDATAVYTAEVSASLGCLSVNGTIAALYLRKDLTTKSFVEIANDGSSREIVSTRFIGSAYTGANSSLFLLGYSVDGTTFPESPDNLYSTESGSTSTLAQVVSFPAASSAGCTETIEYAIPETIYQGAPAGPRTKTYARAEVKKIRLSGESPFQSKSLSGNQLNGENAYLYGLILTVESTSTGLEKESAETSKTPLKISYFDLTGKPVSEHSAKGFLIRRSVYEDGTVGYGKAYAR